MIVLYPFPPAERSRLEALVVAYVNEGGPARGPASLRQQIRAVQRRARRDGVPIGLLVMESGGRSTAEGRGHRLSEVIAAAARDDLERILYVADVNVLASGPEAVLATMRAAFAAGFELREPCGRIAPTGRRVAALVAQATARSVPTLARPPSRPVVATLPLAPRSLDGERNHRDPHDGSPSSCRNARGARGLKAPS